MKKRNLYPDGEYFIRLSNLRHHHDSMKDLLKTYFGEKFDMNMNEYFKSTKKLVVIDHFSKIVNVNKYRYPTFFLRALRVNNIHTIFITRHKLQPMEEMEPCVPWQMKPMTDKQAVAYMLVANKKALFNVDADISKLEESALIQKSRGEPEILDPRLDLVLAVLNYREKSRGAPGSNMFIESDEEEDPSYMKMVDNIQDDYSSTGSIHERKVHAKGVKRPPHKNPKKRKSTHIKK